MSEAHAELRALIEALDFDDPGWPRCLDDLRAELGLAPLTLPPEPAAAWKQLVSGLAGAEARRLHDLRFGWLRSREGGARLVQPSIWMRRLDGWRTLIRQDIGLLRPRQVSWGKGCERLLRWLLVETLSSPVDALTTQLGEPGQIKHRAVELMRRAGDGLWIVRARVQLGCGAQAPLGRRQLDGDAGDAQLGALVRERLAHSARYRPRRAQLPRLLWRDHLDLAVARLEEAAGRDGSRWRGLVLREEARGDKASELVERARLVRAGLRADWEGIPADARRVCASADQPDEELGAWLRAALSA